MIRKTMMVLMAMCMLVAFTSETIAKPKYKVDWSHYTGWEPWDYADRSGILKKWADKFGIEIELTLVNDYVESITLYTGGTYDACVMTNMDALTIPAIGGKDSTAIIVGDYSNGNDGVATKKGTLFLDIKGRTLKLVQFSVSHYLLARALFMNGMSERDVILIHTSDADIGALFISDDSPLATIVTWNPILMSVRQEPGVTMLFDSSKIPGEIQDLLVVRTDAPENLKKALVGAWYETMAVMTSKGPDRDKAISHMAKTAGGTVPEFERQLKTTFMFYTPQSAVDFTSDKKMKDITEFVRSFCFDHNLWQGAKTKDHVGIQFPDGSVMGDPKNIKFRYDTTYMKLAAEGKL
ncbi:MAG: putative urea ABC transporter substrate-binding protein [Patescibacteria group bacterium]